MSTTHVVAPGEHLSGIAEKFGFRDFHTVWDHPSNAALKKQRVNPHVLHPGDSVFIPDKTPRNDPAPTDQKHQYRLDSTDLKLRIALRDFDNQPMTGMACVLVVAGRTFNLKSDGDGIVQTPIPKSATDGVLRLPELDVEHALKIGFLEPLDEDAGWHARLINLGYYDGQVEDADSDQIRSAVEEFQCDNQLTINGELDGATRAKLKEIHGV
ncbi:hypothetical protein BH10PSE17_BH10PSE17_33490 [soil metagenome]